MIDEEADYEAQCALIALLDLTATVRRVEDAVWVDITYLRKKHPRPLLPQTTIERRR